MKPWRQRFIGKLTIKAKAQTGMQSRYGKMERHGKIQRKRRNITD